MFDKCINNLELNEGDFRVICYEEKDERLFFCVHRKGEYSELLIFKRGNPILEGTPQEVLRKVLEASKQNDFLFEDHRMSQSEDD